MTYFSFDKGIGIKTSKTSCADKRTPTPLFASRSHVTPATVEKTGPYDFFTEKVTG